MTHSFDYEVERRNTLRACSLATDGVDLLRHSVLYMPLTEEERAVTKKHGAEKLADALRLLGIPVPDAPTNRATSPGDNCVACTFKSAGLDEMGARNPTTEDRARGAAVAERARLYAGQACEICHGTGRFDDHVCPCPAGDHLNRDPVLTMPVKPRQP